MKTFLRLWLLPGLVAVAVALFATAKLVGAPMMMEQLDRWGLTDVRYIVGGLELAAAVLYLIPRTSSLGTLFISATLGGNYISHLAAREYAGTATVGILLVLAWIGQYLRQPTLFDSFRRR